VQLHFYREPVFTSRWTGFVNAGLVSSNCSQGLLRPYGFGSHQRGPPPSLGRLGDSVVGYFESFLLGVRSQTNAANAAAERIRSHHGCNTIGNKTSSAMSTQNRHPFGIAIYAALSVASRSATKSDTSYKWFTTPAAIAGEHRNVP
jgi:hypothetical protein